MISLTPRARQRDRSPWTRERLEKERAIAIGASIDTSSAASYSSALNSYITFCRIHEFPVEPTFDTFSFYIVFMCHHIKPKSVDSYLSGICNQLEPFFPKVREIRRHRLVAKTLQGCKKLRGCATSRKRPLTRSELGSLAPRYTVPGTNHDDLLFFSILLTGFHGLLRLGELTWPDRRDLQDYRKVIMRNSVTMNDTGYEFYLPGHKGDRFFEGNRVVIRGTNTTDNPLLPFRTYLASSDHLQPYRSELWLRQNGTVPTRAWFMRRLHSHFTDDVGGHSMRAGGATALAEARIPPDLIQAIGRWSSDAFRIYIRQHPVLLAALLYSHPFQRP
jgi:hypothetical protein